MVQHSRAQAAPALLLQLTDLSVTTVEMSSQPLLLCLALIRTVSSIHTLQSVTFTFPRCSSRDRIGVVGQFLSAVGPTLKHLRLGDINLNVLYPHSAGAESEQYWKDLRLSFCTALSSFYLTMLSGSHGPDWLPVCTILNQLSLNPILFAISPCIAHSRVDASPSCALQIWTGSYISSIDIQG